MRRPNVCSVCGQDWMEGWNHSIWCASGGVHGMPQPLIGPLPAPRGWTRKHTPTLEEIEAAMTPAGGWTSATLASWGVPWPPPKGWKQRLIAGDNQEDTP